MSTRTSLCLTKCADDTEPTDYDEACRALRQHSTHAYGCIQFVVAEAYMDGSRK